MGNRTYLELLAAPGAAVAAGRPSIAGDAPGLLLLQANNTLPRFWPALVTDAALAAWAGGVRAAFAAQDADPDSEDGVVPPLDVPWPEASARLRAAVAAAPARVPAPPEWAGWLADWAAALEARGAAGGGAATARLWVEQYAAMFATTADDLLSEVEAGVALWHGPGAVAVAPEPFTDPASELAGFEGATPFPASIPGPPPRPPLPPTGPGPAPAPRVVPPPRPGWLGRLAAALGLRPR